MASSMPHSQTRTATSSRRRAIRALLVRRRDRQYSAGKQATPVVAAYNGTVDVVYYGTTAGSKDDPARYGTHTWHRP